MFFGDCMIYCCVLFVICNWNIRPMILKMYSNQLFVFVWIEKIIKIRSIAYQKHFHNQCSIPNYGYMQRSFTIYRLNIWITFVWEKKLAKINTCQTLESYKIWIWRYHCILKWVSWPLQQMPYFPFQLHNESVLYWFRVSLNLDRLDVQPTAFVYS